jgi:hypothetical protein
MAISPEQRAILIERLKKAQEAKRAKAEARKSAAAAPPSPKAEPKPPKAPKAPKAPKPEKVEKEEKGEKGEIEEKEIEIEEPKPTPIVQEIYHVDKKGTYVEITAAPPYGEPEMLKKRAASKPIDIPAPKATKDKGYMKLKFYKEPSQKVLKKIMKIHDDTSSDDDDEEEALPAPPPQKSQVDAKKEHMKKLADFYFNYY